MWGKLLPLVGLSMLLLSPIATADAAVYGPCRFDSNKLRFGGSVADTTACLLRKVRVKGAGADPQPVPAWLGERVLQPFPFTAAQVAAYLQRKNIRRDAVSDRLVAGDAAGLRYFVIHDTSFPEIEGEFPADINSANWTGNRLSGWEPIAQRVNLLIARDGQSRVMRPWGTVRPKPDTKLEQSDYAAAARPLFVHVENIQPRVIPPGSWAWKAPQPGLGPLQEERLALAYIVASLHAGRWLIPAYHYNIDQGIPNGHDDPQNIDLQSWVDRLIAMESDIRG